MESSYLLETSEEAASAQSADPPRLFPGGRARMWTVVGRSGRQLVWLGLIIAEMLIHPRQSPFLHFSLLPDLGRLAVNLHFNHFS